MAHHLPSQSLFGDYSEWPGRDVLDSGGERLGAVREIYLDRETGHPEWVLVDVDNDTARFVPLADAQVGDGTIRVAHSAGQIRDAPGIDAETQIDQAEERRLYAHYGLGYSEDDSGSGLPSEDAPVPEVETRQETIESATSSPEGEPSTPWGTAEPRTAADSTTPPTGAAEPPTSTSSEAADASIEAPPPAEPPSATEIEAADIPEPPAATDRASEFAEPPAFASPVDTPPALDTPDEPPALEAPDQPPALEPPATPDEPAELANADLAEPVIAQDTATPPRASAAVPPRPAQTERPAWSSPSPEPEPSGPLAVLKKRPVAIAAAAALAAVLGLIIRRLR